MTGLSQSVSFPGSALLRHSSCWLWASSALLTMSSEPRPPPARWLPRLAPRRLHAHPNRDRGTGANPPRDLNLLTYYSTCAGEIHSCSDTSTSRWWHVWVAPGQAWEGGKLCS